MNDELERILEGSGRGLIEIRCWYLTGGTEENHKYPSQSSQFPGRDSKQPPSEYESRALPLSHPFRVCCLVMVMP
jgi:hypothetical protein